MVSVKFGHGLYPNRCPTSVSLAWGIGGAAATVGLLLWVAVDARRSRRCSELRVGEKGE